MIKLFIKQTHLIPVLFYISKMFTIFWIDVTILVCYILSFIKYL